MYEMPEVAGTLASDLSSQSEADFTFSHNSSLCSSTTSSSGAMYPSMEQDICSDILNQAFSEVQQGYGDSGVDMSGFYPPGCHSGYSEDSLSDTSSTNSMAVNSVTYPQNSSYPTAYKNHSHHMSAASATGFQGAFPAMQQPPVAATRGRSNHSNIAQNTQNMKPKRKRVINKVQRGAANVRERKRMVTLNEAFEKLKERIPLGAKDKKLSRIDTLKTAIDYITNMQHMVMAADSQAYMGHHPQHQQHPQPNHAMFTTHNNSYLS